MKILDGQWLIREGLQVFPCAHVQDIETDGRDLLVLLANRDVSARAAQQDGPLLTLRLFAPRTGIIGVRLEHFRDGEVPSPAFELDTEPAPDVETNISPEAATLRSGSLTARVARDGKGEVVFLRDGVPLTRVATKQQGHVIETATECTHMFTRLDLSVGENVYGLGERFTAFVKNGQPVDMWNLDGGTSTEQAYKNIPFYLTSRGYGVFVNDPGRVSFEVASETVDKVQFSVPGEALEYMIIDGPTPAEVVERYTALTARPPLPPAWSFGLWLSTSFTPDYDETTVTSHVTGMTERGIPLSVFHFDPFWMRPYHWCDFHWDTDTFPDPPAMLARLKAMGVRICLWINPYISQHADIFAEGRDKGYLLHRTNGKVWQWDLWQPGQGIIDLTNPAARDWWIGHLRPLVEMGVDTFKTDFGERIPTSDVAWHDGSDPERMHNYYPQLYNTAVHELLAEVRGKDQAVVFSRSATAGGQRLPVHWGGDCTATYESMAETLRGGLSLGLAGFGFWSHDIGGFEHTAPAHLYKRWCAFGMLSSHSRLHGNHTVRVPWAFDEESVDVLRHFTRLKLRLMPYLWDLAGIATERGLPLMRAMLLGFPDDPTCRFLDRQYMLGDKLLVAPVFQEDGEVEFYLPHGRWTPLLGGDEIQGGGWRRERHDFFSLPLYVRENSLLAWSTPDAELQPERDYIANLELQLVALADGAAARAVIRDRQGHEAFTAIARRNGRHLGVSLQGNDAGCRLLVRNERISRETATQTVISDELGDAVAIPPGTSELELDLN